MYSEIKPHQALTSYIDAYWITESKGLEPQKTRILPDGCVDIILNLRDDCKTTEGSILMKSETTYIIGTMTQYNDSILQPGTKLLGIRFKPAAFSVFYKFSSLHEFTDQRIEFEKGLSPDIQETIKYSDVYLNQFFLNKLSDPKHRLMPIIADIQLHHGQITVKNLAQRHFTTSRQLERHFQYYIGITPKEFINLVRYQFTYQKIRNNTSCNSLLQIAFESGYYDQAHLTNEIKKYTGITPSQI